MKVLIIDNSTANLERIKDLLSEHELEIINHTSIEHVDTNQYEMVLLTGEPEALHVDFNNKNFDLERKLIRESTTPIIGICYGAELIAHVFDCKIEEREELRDIQQIEILKDHEIFDGIYEFEVYGSHRFYITKLGSEIEALAKSEDGYEIIRHKEKNIWGFQFHPEKFLDESTGDEMLLNLIEYLNFKNK